MALRPNNLFAQTQLPPLIFLIGNFLNWPILVFSKEKHENKIGLMAEEKEKLAIIKRIKIVFAEWVQLCQ